MDIQLICQTQNKCFKIANSHDPCKFNPAKVNAYTVYRIYVTTTQSEYCLKYSIFHIESTVWHKTLIFCGISQIGGFFTVTKHMRFVRVHTHL